MLLVGLVLLGTYHSLHIEPDTMSSIAELYLVETLVLQATSMSCKQYCNALPHHYKTDRLLADL